MAFESLSKKVKHEIQYTLFTSVYQKTSLQHVSNAKKILMRSPTGFFPHYASEMPLYFTHAACLSSDAKFSSEMLDLYIGRFYKVTH